MGVIVQVSMKYCASGYGEEKVEEEAKGERNKEKATRQRQRQGGRRSL